MTGRQRVASGVAYTDVDKKEDMKVLHGMGYAQELERRLSRFSNFAVSFSIICILAGGITSLQLGVSAVGGAAAGIVWPVGVGFSLIVALCMAQVASAFPTAGGLASGEGETGVRPATTITTRKAAAWATSEMPRLPAPLSLDDTRTSRVAARNR